jgi:hypothetical protein
MEGMIGEVRAVAESIFLGGDWTYIGMVAAAILVGVFAMRNVGQILCVSVLGLVMLGIIWVVYGGATSETPSDPETWMGQLEAGWASIGATTGTTLVSYLIVFAIAIGVLFIAKSLLIRD